MIARAGAAPSPHSIWPRESWIGKNCAGAKRVSAAPHASTTASALQQGASIRRAQNPACIAGALQRLHRRVAQKLAPRSIRPIAASGRTKPARA